ncbi:carbohydrate ABC transporter permease [Halorubrum tebenquichense]|uniref:Binding-protein-dependent transport system inner membrane protein n=1 Tax=Halorubrum tebenquichense DSM 14210 TaxID=1227485 RepID=M0DJN8_9EURY|nr:carbohydrate ABC transporter permease [Halorubrum tebenquichense]ELZ35685.1 binding-protein-dependent transport system inner membrane protein [Halorubrum tebenquichense DSM 14210]
MTDTHNADDSTDADSKPKPDGGRVYHEPPETAPIAEGSAVERLRAAVPSGRRAVHYAVAIGVALLWLVPLVGLFMASVRPLDQIIQGWWNFDTFTVTFENYARAWTFQSGPMRQAMWNTAIVTVPSVLAVTLLGTMVAYPFARFDFPLKKWLFFLLIVVMAAPPELVAMGNYNTLRNTGLFDTYMGLILVHIGWGMGWVVMFLRNFLLGLPEELEEAARIDGASRYQIFKSIVLPYSAPALVSVAVIQFTWVWNSFFFPLVFMRSRENQLAPQVLPLMKGRLQIDWGLVAAGSVLTMIVPILLFVTLQRYYKQGMVAAVAD